MPPIKNILKGVKMLTVLKLKTLMHKSKIFLTYLNPVNIDNNIMLLILLLYLESLYLSNLILLNSNVYILFARLYFIR